MITPSSSAADGLPQEPLLGITFTPIDLEQAVARILARDPHAPFAFVTTPNAQHVVAVDQGDTRYAAAHRAAWLVLNDSAVLARLSVLLLGRRLPLATGADLTLALLERRPPEEPVTLVGGSEEMRRRLGERFAVRDLAWHDPPVGLAHDPAAIRRCAEFVIAHPARLIFLAVGVPQAELVAMEVLRLGGGRGVGLCVGGALNFATGVTRRASPLMRRAGLEALDRLMRNPVGHARRVFVQSLPVLAIAARARLGRGRGAGPR